MIWKSGFFICRKPVLNDQERLVLHREVEDFLVMWKCIVKMGEVGNNRKKLRLFSWKGVYSVVFLKGWKLNGAKI